MKNRPIRWETPEQFWKYELKTKDRSLKRSEVLAKIEVLKKEGDFLEKFQDYKKSYAEKYNNWFKDLSPKIQGEYRKTIFETDQSKAGRPKGSVNKKRKIEKDSDNLENISKKSKKIQVNPKEIDAQGKIVKILLNVSIL